jgi:hypothetical protein
MAREGYCFFFEGTVKMRKIEETLILSIIAVESLYGRSRVRLEVPFLMDAKSRMCVIDATAKPSKAFCRIFTGYLVAEFSPEMIKMRRVMDNQAAK